jgi:hypothetical protein
LTVPPDDLPRSPTGRVPQWVVDEAAGQPYDPEVWRAGPAVYGPQGTPFAVKPVDVPRHAAGYRPPRRRVRGSRGYNAALALFVVAALGGAAWAKGSGWAAQHPEIPAASWLAGLHVDGPRLPAARPPLWDQAAASRAAAEAQASAQAAAEADARKALGFPSPGYEEAAAPLGQPPLVTAPSQSYKFIKTQADGLTPVAWDPCRPIHYVTSTVGAPAGGQALLTQAVAAVSAATGLRFVDDGPTDEVRSDTTGRPLSQPDRYGDRWSPVLVTWDTPQTNPALAGDVAGMAGPQAVTADGKLLVDVTGTVSLDSAQVMTAQKHDHMGAAIVTHELGHLVGLDHVADPTQLMNPVATPGVTTFQAGDLTGLALLGKGACDARL